MVKTISSNRLYISESKTPHAGRGVFANTNIKKGEIIEVCPIIEIHKHDLVNLENSILITYVYFFGRKKDKVLFALGFGSLYNHQFIPNAVYKIKPKEKTIEFIAIKN